ncbi:MAG: hypothetical protein SOZ27_00655 [Spirochaetia bacterium]|nr:hypothetical protein [Spirochaetia bacterium]
MSEMIVRTKEDFKRAVEICPDKIIFKDEMAEVVKKAISQKKLKKKIGIGSGILAGAGVLAGIVAAPFTGGASLGVSALSFAAGTAAAGTITVSMSLVGAGLIGAFIGLGIGLTSKDLMEMLKKYKKVHVNPKTGDVDLEQ